MCKRIDRPDIRPLPTLPPQLEAGQTYYFDGRKAVILSTNCKTWRGSCDAVAFQYEGEDCTYYCTQDTFKRYCAAYPPEKHLTLSLWELSQLGICLPGIRKAIAYCQAGGFGDHESHDLYELFKQGVITRSEAVDLIDKMGLGDKRENNTIEIILRGLAQ